MKTCYMFYMPTTMSRCWPPQREPVVPAIGGVTKQWQKPMWDRNMAVPYLISVSASRAGPTIRAAG